MKLFSFLGRRQPKTLTAEEKRRKEEIAEKKAKLLKRKLEYEDKKLDYKERELRVDDLKLQLKEAEINEELNEFEAGEEEEPIQREEEPDRLTDLLGLVATGIMSKQGGYNDALHRGSETQTTFDRTTANDDGGSPKQINRDTLARLEEMKKRSGEK